MQSLLIQASKEKAQQKALQICKENNISEIDTQIITTEKSVGIGDIREIQKSIFLTPIKSKQKAVILEAFLGMTNDAQNAFLKLLEEPPDNTIIIILTSSLDFVLPTILSRCTVISLNKEEVTTKEIDEYFEIFNTLKNGGTGEALKIAQDYSKDKITALSFLENLMASVHKNLRADKSLGKNLKNIQKTYTIIKTTNVNVRFALENLFLNL